MTRLLANLIHIGQMHLSFTVSNNERVPKNKEIKIDALLGVFLSEKPKMAPQFCPVKTGS